MLDVGLGEATDAEIWAYANQGDYVLLSKDEDFLHLANRRTANARLIWIRLGNCRKHDLFAAIERVWPRILSGLEAGERIVEVR